MNKKDINIKDINKKADISFNNNVFFIEGDLSFSNVMSIYIKSLPSIKTYPDIFFNFEKLNSSDSAGLALIIEWMKFAKQHNKTFHFTNLPSEMMSLAKTAGIDGLLKKKFVVKVVNR